MGWTPLFLNMENKRVLVVGAGEVGSRRAMRFHEAGAQVVITANQVSSELKESGIQFRPLKETPQWVKWADLVVVASGNSHFNQEVCQEVGDKLLNRADNPQEGNVIVPSSFFIGDVQICIFTQGKSPLMAKELRKRIESLIKDEDVLQLELQSFTRDLLRDIVGDQKIRREYLYQILNDSKVKKLLNDGNLEEAQDHVTRFLEEAVKHQSK